MPTQKRGFFYGYWMLLVAFICNFVQSGTTIYAFSLFVKPLQDDFHWSRGITQVAFIFLSIGMGGAAPLVGRLVDRYGVKRVMAAGGLLSGVGLIILSQLSSIPVLYIGYLVVGLGGAACGPISGSALISRWFRKRRGWALGIMGIGVGAGGLVMAPIIGGYLIPSLGWSTAYVVLAVYSWILIIPITLLLVRSCPDDLGLYPDGVSATESAELDTAYLAQATNDFSFKNALKTPTFWLIAISYTLFSFPMQGILQNQVLHLTDIGFQVAAASAALGFVGIGSAVGKFLFGWICDFIKPKYSLAIGIVVQAVALLILMNVSAESPVWVMWLYAILFGLGLGCWLPCISLLVSTNFGLTAYGAIYGMATLIHQPASATGPIIAGVIYDATGGYFTAFAAFLGLYAVAILLDLLVRPPKQPE